MVGKENFPSLSNSTCVILFLVMRLFVENGGQDGGTRLSHPYRNCTNAIFITLRRYKKKMFGEANFPSISYSTYAVLFLVIR
jgi:hypothetical protein